ncbi:MAG: hypothetical protein COC03_06850 [Robiginitomaculum sp.]|nr:MAG: hypothetical protein COC03_06850 [Robiginitomaculum sp.]PHQ67687.1 MAG: hypothetical protein COB92_03795 [Robiginitomaculum sp.]
MSKCIDLNNLDIRALRDVWNNEIKSEPPPIASGSFLMRALEYERQSKKHGNLSTKDLKRLNTYADDQAVLAPATKTTPPQNIKLSAGSRLIRNWNGKTYTVCVIEDGFVYNDKVWPSLSSIARHITGAHWSGPRFFSTRTERIAP